MKHRHHGHRSGDHRNEPRVRTNRLHAAALQTKLTVGPAGDQYEREADRVAKEVVTAIGSTSQTGVETTRRQSIEDEELLQGKSLQRQPEEEELLQGKSLQRQPEEEELLQGKWLQRQPEEEELLQGKWLQRQPEEEELMMKPAVGMEGGDLDADTSAAIDSARGGGSPLPDPVRRNMESAFGGADFGAVRVHTGAGADNLNESLSARAFTTGSDIFLRNGEYQPTTSSGQELLAHELTHVIQQGHG